MKSRTEILVPIAAIQAVPITVIAWYRLHRYAWYRYSAIVNWRLKESLKLRETKPSRDKFQIKANKHIQQFNRYTIEALLQHYVGRTRFLDVVDNHWIALWMGLHKFQMHGKGARYCACKKRQLLLGDMLEQLVKECPLIFAPLFISALLQECFSSR